MPGPLDPGRDKDVKSTELQPEKPPGPSCHGNIIYRVITTVTVSSTSKHACPGDKLLNLTFLDIHEALWQKDSAPLTNLCSFKTIGSTGKGLNS